MKEVEQLFNVSSKEFGEAVVNFDLMRKDEDWEFPQNLQRNIETLVCEIGKDLGLRIPLMLIPDVFLIAGFMFAVGRLVERGTTGQEEDDGAGSV